MLEVILPLPPIDQVVVEGVHPPEILQEHFLASLQDLYQSLVDIIRLPPMRAGLYRKWNTVAIEDKFDMRVVTSVKGGEKVVHWQFDEFLGLFRVGRLRELAGKRPDNQGEGGQERLALHLLTTYNFRAPYHSGS